jgi:DNA polymerase-1
MSAFGLSQQLGIPPSEAKRYIDQYFDRYQGVRKWIDDILQDARVKGYVTTLLGRIRYLPEITASNQQLRGFAERTAMNTPVQGTSADIIKVAMLRIQEKLAVGGFSTRMLVQVHDELLFEVPEREMDTVVPLLKREMENALTLAIPVVAEFKAGGNWDAMTPLKIDHEKNC